MQLTKQKCKASVLFLFRTKTFKVTNILLTCVIDFVFHILFFILQSFGHDHMLTFSALKQLGLYTELDVSISFISQHSLSTFDTSKSLEKNRTTNRLHKRESKVRSTSVYRIQGQTVGWQSLRWRIFFCYLILNFTLLLFHQKKGTFKSLSKRLNLVSI